MALCIQASLESRGLSASLSTGGGISASMTPNLPDAWFSVSCPIDFSLFLGWDDDLGWDDETGWLDQ